MDQRGSLSSIAPLFALLTCTQYLHDLPHLYNFEFCKSVDCI